MKMRVALVLPGLGRVQRGAETAFVELARGLAARPDTEVELFGTGRQGLDGLAAHVLPCVPRERFEGWPRLPGFRGETWYEEFTFATALALRRAYRPKRFDITLSCTFPHVHGHVRRAGRGLRDCRRPLNVYVTQNGDWPCRRTNAEFRAFHCDGLVCTNPEYFDRHRDAYPSALIPNGVDPDVYRPGKRLAGPNGDAACDLLPREQTAGRRVVLMVSALIPSKRVDDGIRALARVPDAYLLLAGDGPCRQEIQALAARLLPGRHRLLGNLPHERMPGLYHRADALLHASQEEPFGIVYLEGAASGLPVVAHDWAVTRWILGDTALYADTGDAEALAGAIGQALRPEVARDLGARARARVLDGWTWRHQADRYRDFFARLLHSRREQSSARVKALAGVALSR